VSSSLIGSFEGTILAASFGKGEATAEMPRVYAWGTLAGLGWGCRFSIPLDAIPLAVRDTLEGGHNIPVVVHGTVTAQVKRGEADYSIKADALEAAGGSKTNGKVPATAAATS
jgi:hypothetical protein